MEWVAARVRAGSLARLCFEGLSRAQVRKNPARQSSQEAAGKKRTAAPVPREKAERWARCQTVGRRARGAGALFKTNKQVQVIQDAHKRQVKAAGEGHNHAAAVESHNRCSETRLANELASGLHAVLPPVKLTRVAALIAKDIGSTGSTPATVV